jgi:hypothetical protein
MYNLKEICRDLLAFGSLPFYFIFIIRAWIGNYMSFVYQLILSFIILFVISFFVRNNQHLGRAFILVFFSSLFYADSRFTIFAYLLWILMLVCAYYLKQDKKELILGVILGILSSLVSYYLVIFI